jgi:hypothetical protein
VCLLRLLELLYQGTLLGQFPTLDFQFLLLLLQELLHALQGFLQIFFVGRKGQGDDGQTC